VFVQESSCGKITFVWANELNAKNKAATAKTSFTNPNLAPQKKSVNVPFYKYAAPTALAKI